MQIFLYLKHFPPTGDWLHEGTTKAVHGLASGLVNAGAAVTILCENYQTSLHRATAGYTIACFKNSRSTAPSLRVAPELKAFLRAQAKNSESLVILNGIFHRSVYVLSRFLRRTQIPYVVAPHDPYHPSIFQTNRWLKFFYWHLLEKNLLQQAQAVQVLDQRHEKWLRSRGVKTSVVAVPNGFEPSDVLPPQRLVDTQLALSQAPAKLVFLGRIDRHHKGLDILLQSIAAINHSANPLSQNPTNNLVQLTLQGPDWGDRCHLIQQAETLGLLQTVNFLGADYEQTAAALIAQHEVFCLPSRFEGFGLVALEAMLAGRVLLVSEIAGIAPHVAASGCGIVVNPTVNDVQQGIEHLLKIRSQWTEMGQRGRQYALTHLKWQDIAARAMDQYQILLDTAPRKMALNSSAINPGAILGG
jgi:glycosyltransferase involved in cell wall biosynthesis